MDELNEYFEPLLKPSDVSKWLNVSVSTIYKWAETGYIPTVDLGGKIRGPLRFAKAEVARWYRRRLRRGRSTPNPNVDEHDNN
jgi:excisionase family DNA binding protein